MNGENTDRKSTLSAIILVIVMLLAFGGPLAVMAAEDYLSTGFGKTRREMHPEYALMLQFSLRTGAYIADVDVDLFENGKEIKSIESAGPWLFVNLEPGSYSVVATLDDGRKQGAQFTITPDQQTKVILSWPKE